MDSERNRGENSPQVFTRRDFFRLLKTVPALEEDGISKFTPRYPLNDLGAWPDETLAAITPIFRQDLKISLEKAELTAYNEVGECIVAIPITDRQHAVVDLFDGQRNLKQIASHGTRGHLGERRLASHQTVIRGLGCEGNLPSSGTATAPLDPKQANTPSLRGRRRRCKVSVYYPRVRRSAA